LELFGGETLPAAGGGGGGSPRLGVGRGVAVEGGVLLEELLGPAAQGLGEGPLLGGGDALEVAVKGVRKLDLSFHHDGEMMEREE